MAVQKERSHFISSWPSHTLCAGQGELPHEGTGVVKMVGIPVVIVHID